MSEPEKNRKAFGFLGVLIGALAFATAALHFFEGPFETSPPIEETIANKAVDIRDAVVARLKGESVESAVAPPGRSIDDWVRMGIVGSSTLAILLAVASFIRREDARMSGSALALGGGALAFPFLAIAIGVVVLVAIIGAVLGNLDFLS